MIPPANAGDMHSTPGLGRSHMPRSNEAHAPQLLSLCATQYRAHMLQLLRPMCPGVHAPQREDPLKREAGAAQMRIGPTYRN